MLPCIFNHNLLPVRCFLLFILNLFNWFSLISWVILGCKRPASSAIPFLSNLFLLDKRCFNRGDIKGGSLDDILARMDGKQLLNSLWLKQWNLLVALFTLFSAKTGDQSVAWSFCNNKLLWWSRASRNSTTDLTEGFLTLGKMYCIVVCPIYWSSFSCILTLLHILFFPILFCPDTRSNGRSSILYTSWAPGM